MKFDVCFHVNYKLFKKICPHNSFEVALRIKQNFNNSTSTSTPYFKVILILDTINFWDYLSQIAKKPLARLKIAGEKTPFITL
jgi:hypothetical protein